MCMINSDRENLKTQELNVSKEKVTFTGWIEVNSKIGIVIGCYLKWATEKEWKKTYFILKKPTLSRLLENQLFLRLCQINASESVSAKKLHTSI